MAQACQSISTAISKKLLEAYVFEQFLKIKEILMKSKLKEEFVNWETVLDNEMNFHVLYNSLAHVKKNSCVA